MRKIMILSLVALASSLSAGCIMVIDGSCRSSKLGEHKRIVKIDGESYVIDVRQNTAFKLDDDDNHESEETDAKTDSQN